MWERACLQCLQSTSSYIWAELSQCLAASHLFTPPSPASHHPDVCTRVPAEIFTPGLLLLGATQSPPQMCPVSPDKEEHGQLITMWLHYRIQLLRDCYFSLYNRFFFLPFSSVSWTSIGIHLHRVSPVDLNHPQCVRTACNGIVKRVYRCNVCGDHLKCESS